MQKLVIDTSHWHYLDHETKIWCSESFIRRCYSGENDHAALKVLLEQAMPAITLLSRQQQDLHIVAEQERLINHVDDIDQWTINDNYRRSLPLISQLFVRKKSVPVHVPAEHSQKWKHLEHWDHNAERLSARLNQWGDHVALFEWDDDNDTVATLMGFIAEAFLLDIV